MNSTSPSSRLVSRAAKSPARSNAGPDVILKPTSISLATMPAKVVFPSPGGPAKRVWSTGSPRFRAAPRRISRCSRTSGWPSNSARRLGRRPTSSGSSVGSADATSTSSLTQSPRRRQESERVTQERVDVAFRGQLAQHVTDLIRLVAEAGECRTQVGAPRAAAGRDELEIGDLEPALQIEQ